MPGVLTNDIISIILDGRLFGQQVMLTTHWKVTEISPGAEVDMGALFTQINTDIGTVGGLADTYAAATSESLINIINRYQVVHPARWVSVPIASTHPVGEVAEPSLPPNVAHVITCRSDVAGPHQKGNKHITAVPPSFTENGLLTAAGRTELGDLGAALVSVFTPIVAGDTVTLAPVVFNKAAPATSVLINNFILGDTTRVQRRRTVGLGT